MQKSRVVLGAPSFEPFRWPMPELTRSQAALDRAGWRFLKIPLPKNCSAQTVAKEEHLQLLMLAQQFREDDFDPRSLGEVLLRSQLTGSVRKVAQLAVRTRNARVKGKLFLAALYVGGASGGPPAQVAGVAPASGDAVEAQVLFSNSRKRCCPGSAVRSVW